MNEVIKLKDITTAEQLRARIEDGALSVGNKLSVVRKFGTESRVNDSQVEVKVTYCTAMYGAAKKVWFI